MMKFMHVQTELSLWKKGHKYNGLLGNATSLFPLFLCLLSLTLKGIKPFEAGVSLGVWEVGVESEREAAPRDGEQRGVNSGLELLESPFTTQNWD